MARVPEKTAMKMAERRKKDLSTVNADAIASSCPSCKTALMDGKFYDIAELVVESMIK